MVEIKKCGSYLQVDENGFVIPIDSSSTIQSKWLPIINDVIKFYQSEFKENLHSVYIRGSVAKASAVDFVSDLDSFAVLNIESEINQQNLISFEKELNQKYPFCNHAEITLVSLNDVHAVPDKRKRSIWDELIKTQSRCVFGVDLAISIEPFRLNEMIGHSLYIVDEIKKLPTYIEEDRDDPLELEGLCVWITRRVLRAGFDLVMEREQRFSRDLYCCYESTIKYYPELEINFKNILDLSLNPTAKVDRWLPLVNELGQWFELNIKK